MSTPRKPLGEAEFNQLFHTYHKPVFSSICAPCWPGAATRRTPTWWRT